MQRLVVSALKKCQSPQYAFTSRLNWVMMMDEICKDADAEGLRTDDLTITRRTLSEHGYERVIRSL